VSTRAAQKATRGIPIVALVGFPVESGFVASLARPGGNITGVAVIADQASAKRLELLKELFPQLRRVAVLWDPVTHERQPQAVAAAARKLGIDVEVVRAKASELDGAFAVALAARAEAILVLVSPAFTGNRRQLVRLAAQHRLPAMYPNQSFTDAGGLIAYGPTLDEMWGLMARYVDRILKGARAAELPVEQPTRFELDINLTAARQIGIQVPQSVLVRANRVIE
jgi:putative ABC transport system substrate-binding protein